MPFSFVAEFLEEIRKIDERIEQLDFLSATENGIYREDMTKKQNLFRERYFQYLVTHHWELGDLFGVLEYSFL